MPLPEDLNMTAEQLVKKVGELDAENYRMRRALQNCRLFFDANNRPSHVEMIDDALASR